jgi:hypothetical protein
MPLSDGQISMILDALFNLPAALVRLARVKEPQPGADPDCCPEEAHRDALRIIRELRELLTTVIPEGSRAESEALPHVARLEEGLAASHANDGVTAQVETAFDALMAICCRASRSAET